MQAFTVVADQFCKGFFELWNKSLILTVYVCKYGNDLSVFDAVVFVFFFFLTKFQDGH